MFGKSLSPQNILQSTPRLGLMWGLVCCLALLPQINSLPATRDDGDMQPVSSGRIAWKNYFGALPDQMTAPDLTKENDAGSDDMFKLDEQIFKAAHATDAQQSVMAFGGGTDELVNEQNVNLDEKFPHIDLSKYRDPLFWKGAFDDTESDDPFFSHRDTPEENPDRLMASTKTRSLDQIQEDRMQMSMCRLIEESQFDQAQECAMCMNVVPAVIKQTWICACYRNPLDSSNYDKCVDMKQEMEKDREQVVTYLHAHHLDPRMASPRVCEEWGYCPGHG